MYMNSLKTQTYDYEWTFYECIKSKKITQQICTHPYMCKKTRLLYTITFLFAVFVTTTVAVVIIVIVAASDVVLMVFEF